MGEQGVPTIPTPTTREKLPTPDACNCCYSTAAASIAIAEAVADATAEASAYASAFARATVQIEVIIEITIGIGILVAAVALAMAFAQAVAIAIALAVAVAIAIAVALTVALAAVPRLRRPPLHRCTVLLDIPPTASRTNPLPPAVVWETINPGGAHHVDVLASTDGGLNFAPAILSGGAATRGLPTTGSFIWSSVQQSPAGTVALIVAIAFDAAGQEVCRSRTSSLRVLP
jgi:hypothetical protein